MSPGSSIAPHLLPVGWQTACDSGLHVLTCQGEQRPLLMRRLALSSSNSGHSLVGTNQLHGWRFTGMSPFLSLHPPSIFMVIFMAQALGKLFG